MKRSDETDALVHSALGPFSANKSVQYRVRHLVEKRLTGGEVTVMVVTLVLSGFLKSAGTDLWDAVKRLFTELRKSRSPETDHRLVLTIKESVGKSSVEFKYTLQSISGLDTIDVFLAEVERARSEVQNSDAAGQDTIRFRFDGRTMERE